MKDGPFISKLKANRDVIVWPTQAEHLLFLQMYPASNGSSSF